MKILMEERVHHALSYLRPAEAAKVKLLIQELQDKSFETLKSSHLIRKLSTGDENLYIMRIDPKLRLIFKCQENGTVTIENIVSHDLLKQFAGQVGA